VGGVRRWRSGKGQQIWCKYCVHMYVNGKMIPVETIPGMGGGRIKENGGGVNSSMIYLIHYKNFCKCHNLSSPSTTIK
jgi:hypothetical protein